ncbi:MAG: hypothetical protein IPG39_21620 [Bacteroidetes bacterium]|nr:hypothetical protein [Bacteroidota bacterium]
MMNTIKIIAILVVFSPQKVAQTAPFQIAIEPMNIAGFGGLSICVRATQWQVVDYWATIGWLTADNHLPHLMSAGHNNQLIVVDPVAQQNGRLLYHHPIGARTPRFYQHGISPGWKLSILGRGLWLQQ